MATIADAPPATDDEIVDHTEDDWLEAFKLLRKFLDRNRDLVPQTSLYIIEPVWMQVRPPAEQRHIVRNFIERVGVVKAKTRGSQTILTTDAFAPHVFGITVDTDAIAEQVEVVEPRMRPVWALKGIEGDLP